MTRFGWTVLGSCAGILVIVIALLMWLYGSAKIQQASVLVEEIPRTLDPTTLAIYTSGTHGVSFFYPATAFISDEFSSTSTRDWRARPLAAGTPIVEVVLADGEVRLGASTTTSEVAGCLSPSATETDAGITVIGSTTWNVFSSSRLGTDAERTVRSYRSVRESSCYALELFLPQAITPETATGPRLILESFTFVN